MALSLPVLVPGIITALLWALPGNPAEIICPREICPATDALAARWRLDKGPWYFYTCWMRDALTGEFGNSWRFSQGTSVTELVVESLPVTASLVVMALLLLLVASALAATRRLPKELDALWQVMGVAPAIVLALAAAAAITLQYGALSFHGWPGFLRLLSGAAVLSVADGALAAAIVGTRTTFEDEFKQRYVSIAVLRGESPFLNALPNVLPALLGQLRGRVLHLLSGAVVVEIVLQISGLGELLFLGTLKQDFGVVLAASFAFCLMSMGIISMQALSEALVAWYIHRHPALAEETEDKTGKTR